MHPRRSPWKDWAVFVLLALLITLWVVAYAFVDGWKAGTHLPNPTTTTTTLPTVN
jgi:peptidoglycan/LPS O-acetylase OafA/YrhL